MSNVIKKTALVVLAAFAFANAAVIFEDDFTDQLASHPKWAPSLAANVSGGSCALTNSSATSFNRYVHDLGPAKPTVFTLSFVLKPGLSGDAGMFFCKQSTQSVNGYYITVLSDTLLVRKFVNNNSEGADVLHYKRSLDIKAGDNLITVSKNGSTFYLYVNDIFQGEFIDNQFSSGDIALFLFHASSVTFGTVSMTNTFKDERPNSFSDNFTDISLKHWEFVNYTGRVQPELSISGQAGLDVKINSNSPLGMYIDANFTEFEMRVEVTHSNGHANTPYGILLVGEVPPAGGTIPMIYFGIRGNQRLFISSPSGTHDATNTSPGIFGSILKIADTLVVKKSAGSSNFEFIVNGTTLSNDLPAAGFKIAGVGLFSYRTPEATDAMQLLFSNFSVEWENSSTSITWNPKQRPAIGSKPFIPNSGQVFYDLRGRKRFTTNQSLPRGAQNRAAGMYLNEHGREIQVRKTPQK